MPINDNDSVMREPTEPPSDAHGQAALLLVESLIHSLRESSILSISDAIDIVETAIDVQADLIDAADGADSTMIKSHAALSSIAKSLKHDGNGSNGDNR